MKRQFVVAAVALFAVAAVAPAFAGGSGCSHSSASYTSNEASCHGKSATSAWSGAWLQRSSSGVVVAEVAKGSPAAKAGLKKGDVVLAVNGYNVADSKKAAMCASSAECSVGSTVAYTVQRGSSTKSVKVKLQEMPESATARFADRNASFEPAFAAVVIPVAN